MASEEGRPNLPARSPEQRLHALAKANQVRSARAQLKRDLAAGTVELARILADPPAHAQTARVRELLIAVPVSVPPAPAAPSPTAASPKRKPSPASGAGNAPN